MTVFGRLIIAVVLKLILLVYYYGIRSRKSKNIWIEDAVLSFESDLKCVIYLSKYHFI